jgi:hypothetical protein
MTDRTRTLIVVLDKDYRVDDAEGIINAIKMVKGVHTVDHDVVDINDHAARRAVASEVHRDIVKALDKAFYGV